jgi:hypothetical protein
MMTEIPNLFPVAVSILNSDLMKAQTLLRDQIEESQLFQIGYQKSLIASIKRQYFAKNPVKKFVVIASFNNYDFLSTNINGRLVESIWFEEFAKFSKDPKAAAKFMQDAVAIISNNTINRIGLEKFAEIYKSTPHAIYILQDIDSHHWREMSVQVPALVDVYAPGHTGSFISEGRINPNLVTGIPIGTTQWSRDFVLQHIPELANSERLDQPFGMHSFYPKFKFRNQVVATLSKFSPHTGLQNTTETNGFLGRDPEQRWKDWAKYKLHWIIPVANDLPNRFFDALITGGLALTPKQFRSTIKHLGIPDEFICYYEPIDILDPQNFIKAALKQFEDQGGNLGAVKRARFTLEHLHVDKIMDDLFDAALEFYPTESGIN